MRFQIMQGIPSYRADETSAEEPIAGQEGMLLRLLLLRGSHAVTKDEIADHLTRSGRHRVLPSSVPGYVARLRDQVGHDCVRSTAGYFSAVVRTEVDAFVFEDAVRQYGVCDITDVDDVELVADDRYLQLLELHSMWRANPAMPFADYYDDEHLLNSYREFEHYWESLKRAIIYCELRSRRKPRIEKAIGRIEQLLRQDPVDEQLWALLVRARASLSQHETIMPALLARISEQFPVGMPGELRYTISRIESGHADSLFEVDRRTRRHEDQQKIDELSQAIGISCASELELRRSKLEPLECIGQAVSQLCFAGILATKWVADSYVRAEFERLLERLDNTGGSVRFLLIDPESEGYRRFSSRRWSSGGTHSVDILRALSAAHPSFSIRLYDALPTFRIVLIDQRMVSFSPYLMDTGARSGWEAPHVVLDRTAPWPLARAFETLFDENWRIAKPLSPPNREPA